MGVPKGRAAGGYDLPEDFEKLSARDRIVRLLGDRRPDDDRFTTAMIRDQLTLDEVIVYPNKTARVTFKFPVKKMYCNYSGNLHGGAQATLMDMCTSCALAPIAKPGFWMYGGVSRVLTVKYLRPAPEGEDLIVDCEVVHAGQRIAAVKGTLKRASDGAIISICDHDKANTDPPAASKL